MRRRALSVALIATAVGVAAALVVISGVVPIKASSGHWPVTAWFLHFAMQRSVATHSIGIEAPPLKDARLVLMGAGHYEGGCRSCHGAPGAPRPAIVTHMTPQPPDLSARVGEYDDAALFYIVRHGIKMTGMPAWPAAERDDEVWAVVAFLRTLPKMDAVAYRSLVTDEAVEAAGREAPSIVVRVCARCHGVDGLGRGVGAFPRLAAQRSRYLEEALLAYAAGRRHSGIMQPIARDLDHGDIATVVGWYATRPESSARGGRSDARGQIIAKEGVPGKRVPACMACHGPGAGIHHPAYPRLAGQYAAYLEQQLHLFTEGKRGGSPYAKIMKASVHALVEPEIEQVARYYAALPRGKHAAVRRSEKRDSETQ